MQSYLIIVAALSSFLVSSKADTHPDNFMMSFDKDLKRFGMFRNKRNIDAKDKNHKKMKTIKTKNLLDDYEVAEEKIFNAVEKVEKVAVDVAESLVHDEVDVLFGKDHVHSIRDGKTISLKLDAPVRARRSIRMPFGVRKSMKNVKVTDKSSQEKKNELPHNQFLDFMDTYAEHCHTSEMF